MQESSKIWCKEKARIETGRAARAWREGGVRFVCRALAPGELGALAMGWGVVPRVLGTTESWEKCDMMCPTFKQLLKLIPGRGIVKE